MSPWCVKAALVIAAGAPLGACASHSNAHPNPPPPAGYVVVCDTYPLPLVQYYAYCRPATKVREKGVVVRAKG